MFYHRGFSHDVEALHFKVIVLCAIFCVSTFGPCTMTGTHNPTGYIDLNTGSENVLIGDTRKQIQPPKLNIENICKRSDLFCFPSTLSDFLSDFYITEANNSGFSGVKLDETVVVANELRSTNHGNFQLLNGNTVSCSLELKENIQDKSNENDTPFVRIKSNRVNDFLLPNVQISHPLLDWGQKYLHIPSLAYLTVENRHKNSILQVFEPYSTNRQFYPCNNSEINIGPAQNASICFVFLPKWLGSSSGQLILQTSSGGFLVRAQGFAVEPPYMIQSSVGSGSGPRVVSVFNPSDKELLVKEVNAWISFSSGNASYSVSGVCNVMNQTGSSDYKFNKQLEVKIGQVGQQVMMIRPQKTWTVGPNRKEPILDLEFPFHSHENIHGLFCVQLLKTDSRDKFDTLVFEAEFGGKLVKDILLISLDVLMACDGNGTTIVSLLVENDSPDLLTVVNIGQLGENEASLQTKYVKGLILFPHSVTQIATVTYSPNSHLNLNCKLVVQTNKSKDHELEISCSEIARLCSRENLNYENAEIRSSNVVHAQPSSEIKATEMTKADESVLGNWRSHKTQNGFSVLDDNELIFPMVQIGQYQSKWVNIINPSNQPVIVQLVLNSGEIITECREWDEILNPYSSYNLVLGNQKTPSRYGFSIPENALTEAYVHPHGNTVLGPIVFHPSDRCSWKSSVLVRNNLSGVEWLSLRGSGGSVLLTLLDRSNPVHRIELKRNYGQLFMRVLYAKNTGDLPIKVEKISVSGTKCELNGFVVGSCKGFDLQPGGSQKIIISYFSEYCAETVRRDLELGMTGGVLVIPMEVSLPVETRKVCKRSLFWTRFKKFAVAVLILVIFMVCFGTYSFIIKGGNSSVVGSVTEIPDSVPESVEEVTTSASLAVEESKPENLRVNTRARRRRKKRNSGLGSTGLNEASSSHSSNSTPSVSMPSSPCQNVRAVNHGGTSAVLPPEEKEERPSTLPKTASPSARVPEVEGDVVEPIQVVADDERAPEVERDVVEPIQVIADDERAPEVEREVEPIQENPGDERAPDVKREVVDPIQEIPDDERAPEVKRDVVEPIQEIPDDERAPEVVREVAEPIQEIPDDERAPEVQRAPEVVREVAEPIQEIPDDERAPEVQRAPEVKREVVEPIQEIPDVERAREVEETLDDERAPEVEEIREENDDWIEYNMWDHHLQPRGRGSIGPVMPGENNFSSFFNMSPQDLFGPYKLQTHVSSKEED